ncbi:hypothetical protein [[Flexibacter] sp. ATCC 35208]|uniref:hypothetical protein n=1 Tax=[Flexibacter] sp. ATCC 35208 TaxID=1936242 RepID=UPI0009CB3DE7|nr:hypothetical protein [[Flexibacter] sp. ATCC 35208]OMP80075.1 hypothetical protein BW716_06170 [[Flexibacter] sp. ATCC 35208]
MKSDTSQLMDQVKKCTYLFEDKGYYQNLSPGLKLELKHELAMQVKSAYRNLERNQDKGIEEVVAPYIMSYPLDGKTITLNAVLLIDIHQKLQIIKPTLTIYQLSQGLNLKLRSDKEFPDLRKLKGMFNQLLPKEKVKPVHIIKQRFRQLFNPTPGHKL